MLGHTFFVKTKVVRECHSITSFPEHKNTGRTGTRANLVGPERALEQVGGP